MNNKYVAKAYEDRSYIPSEIDLVRCFEEGYEKLIDETRVLHIHPSHKSRIEPFLVSYKKDLYYKGIKVDFNQEVPKNKAYLEEKHLGMKKELN